MAGVERVFVGDYPLEVYRFLRDDAGADFIQLIPIVERIDDAGQPADTSGNRVSAQSVAAEQFGDFLVAIFEEWARIFWSPAEERVWQPNSRASPKPGWPVLVCRGHRVTIE